MSSVILLILGVAVLLGGAVALVLLFNTSRPEAGWLPWVRSAWNIQTEGQGSPKERLEQFFVPNYSTEQIANLAEVFDRNTSPDNPHLDKKIQQSNSCPETVTWPRTTPSQTNHQHCEIEKNTGSFVWSDHPGSRLWNESKRVFGEALN